MANRAVKKSDTALICFEASILMVANDLGMIDEMGEWFEQLRNGGFM